MNSSGSIRPDTSGDWVARQAPAEDIGEKGEELRCNFMRSGIQGAPSVQR